MLQEAAEAAASCGSNTAQFGTLRASTPSGKAKTKQNCTPKAVRSPLGNAAIGPTEQQEKSHAFPQRFYHLSLGMGEASPPSCEQASVFFWLFFFFLCNQSKFLRDESQGFKGVQGDVKQASSVNQRHTLLRGRTLLTSPFPLQIQDKGTGWMDVSEDPICHTHM